MTKLLFLLSWTLVSISYAQVDLKMELKDHNRSLVNYILGKSSKSKKVKKVEVPEFMEKNNLSLSKIEKQLENMLKDETKVQIKSVKREGQNSNWYNVVAKLSNKKFSKTFKFRLLSRSSREDLQVKYSELFLSQDAPKVSLKNFLSGEHVNASNLTVKYKDILKSKENKK